MAVVDAEVAAFRDREAGRSPCGIVTIRDFDQGVVETLGAKVFRVGDREGYYIPGLGIDPPPSLPGIPVLFSNPEHHEVYLLPSLVVSRESIAPANNRWHPGTLQYRVPKPGALPLRAVGPGGVIKTGYSKQVAMPAPIPYDLSYTIQILHERRGLAAHRTGLALLHYVMRTYQPYCLVKVLDSLGDLRLYFAIAESVDAQDELMDIADRVAGWSLSLTVEALLDLNDEEELAIVTDRQFNLEVKRS